MYKTQPTKSPHSCPYIAMLETTVNYCPSIVLNKSTYSGGGGDSPFGDIISILIAMTTNQLQKKTFHAADVSVKICNTLGHQTLKSLA